MGYSNVSSIINPTIVEIKNNIRDWGLYPNLSINEYKPRKKIFQPWIYVVATIVNIILRFAWIARFTLLLKKIEFELFFIVLEIIRRWLWVFFRFERDDSKVIYEEIYNENTIFDDFNKKDIL